MSDEGLVVFELSTTEKAYLARLDGRRGKADLAARDIVREHIVREGLKELRKKRQRERKTPAAPA